MADGEVRFEASVETKKAMKNLASAEKSFTSLGEKIDQINRKIKAFEDAQMNSTSKSSTAYRKLLQLQKELADAEQRRAKIQGELSRKQSEVANYTRAFNERDAMTDAKKAERIELQKKLDVSDPDSAKDPEEYAATLERIKVLTEQIDEDSKISAALEQQKNKAMKEEESIAKELARSEEKVSALRQKVTTQGSVSEKARVDDARKWVELQLQLNKLTEKYQAALQRVRDLERQVSQSKRDDRRAAMEEQEQARLQALKKVLTTVKNAYANFGKVAFNVAKSLTITPILNTFNKLHKSVLRFGKRLKFVLLQGLLFRNMRKYLSEFAQAMGSALSKNEQFNASLANLKGTFWAAIAPVIDAVAPILARFLDMIARLITYLSGLVGILFGIGKASKVAGAGLASAGEKGKEASNNLASWDTIQNLDSGSGGDSGSGISPTFGQDFDEAYAKLEKFRELFEKGNWFEIGKYVGEELSKVVTLIDTWITGTLAPNIIKWAKNIGSFINGFFVGMDWSNLGKTVGDAIVAVFDGISTFFAIVDWKKVGQSVKEFLLGIDWGAVLKSVGNAIVNAIVAAMDFAQGLTGIDLTTFIEDFQELFDLFSDIIDLLSGDMTFKEWFSQLSDDQLDLVYWASAVGVILSVIGVFKLLSSVVSLFTNVIIPAFTGAINFLMAHPIVLIIAGILILIRVIIQVIKHWDEIKEVAEKVITAVKDWVSKAVEDIKNWVTKFIDRIVTAIGTFIQTVKGWIKAVVDYVVNWWKTLVEKTKAFIEQIKVIIDTVKQKINSVIQAIIGFAKNLWNNLVNIFNNIKNKALDIINTIKSAIRTAINFIIRILNGMISGVESAVNWIVSGLNKISFSIPSWVPGIGGKRFGFDLSSVYFGRIPELAQGAVVNPSHEFAAILGDNRQEQEIVSPLSTMKQALLDALSEYSGNTEVVLEVDGRKFATAMIPHINNRTRAYGTPVIL